MNKRTREDAYYEAIQDGLRKWFDYLASGDEALQRDIEEAYKERVIVLQKIAISARITPEMKNRVIAELETKTREDARQKARETVRNPVTQARVTPLPSAFKLNAMLSASASSSSSSVPK